MRNIVPIIVLLMIYSCCVDPDECADNLRLFGVFQHNTNEFVIGDTINFSYSFSTKVPGYNTEGDLVGTFDCAHIDWMPLIFVYRIDTSIEVRQSKFEGVFDFVPSSDYDLKLDGISTSDFVTGSYVQERDSFFLDVSLIPLKKGLFLIGIARDVGGGQSFDGCCDRCMAGFDISYDLETNSPNDYADLLSESPAEIYNTWMKLNLDDRYYRNGSVIVRIR